MLLFLKQKKIWGDVSFSSYTTKNIAYFLPNIVSLVYKINKADFYYIVWSHRFNGVGMPYM